MEGPSKAEGRDTKLEMSQERLEHLINMSECGMMILKLQAEPEILYANDYFYRNLQYTRKEYEEKYGNAAMAAVVPEEKQKIKALIARQSAAGGTLQLEYRAFRRDGSLVWLSLAARPAYEEDGQLLYYCSCLDISKAKFHLEDALRSKKDLHLIANNIPGGVIKLRMSDFRLLYANDGFFRLAGYSRAEYSMNFQDSCDRVIHPDDVERVKQVVQTAVENRGLLGLEYRIIAKNGETRWSYANGTRIDDDQGAPVYLCVIVDITTRKLCEEELADNDHRAELVSQMLKETLWTYDISRRVIQRSGELASTYSPESLLEGYFSEEKVREYIHPEDVEHFLAAYQEWVCKIGEYRGQFRVRTDQGIYQKMEICTISEGADGVTPDRVYGITRMIEDDISSGMAYAENMTGPGQKELGGKVMDLARSAQNNAKDKITELLPYGDFLKKAGKILAERKEEDNYAVVCADINEFRKFSRNYGISVSNCILKIFSEVLLSNLAMDDMCSRVDGDYFVLLSRYEDHKELLHALSAAVRDQEKKEGKEGSRKFGSTIGIYLVQAEDHELLEMLEKADLARRSIKGLMGNHYAIYTDEVLLQKTYDEATIEEIRNAMHQKRIEICYLPRFQDEKDKIIGCKAVMRVPLESGQYLSGQQLMQLSERGAQLEDLGFYVLQEAAKSMGAWRIRGNRTVPLAIEMTASQLSMNQAVNKIHNNIVKQNGLKPEDFIFEIPERYFLHSTTAFELAIKELAERGYRIVVSRFGTDHTAIHTIRRLPVHGIKFHGEFFASHMISDKDTIIFQKLVEMAEELGMTVVCGGIQTKLQEEFARKIGCKVFEGDMYYGAVRSNVLEKCFLS